MSITNTETEYPIRHTTYIEIDGPPTTPFSAGEILSEDADALPEPWRGCLLDLIQEGVDQAECSYPGCKHPVGFHLMGEADEIVAWAFTVLATDDVEDDILTLCEDHHPGLPVILR